MMVGGSYGLIDEVDLDATIRPLFEFLVIIISQTILLQLLCQTSRPFTAS